MSDRMVAYTWVSTHDQNPKMQLDSLEAHGYDRLVTEESGKRGVDRPEWRACLAELRAGDTFVFWKSERCGRCAANVLTTHNELRDRGVRARTPRWPPIRRRGDQEIRTDPPRGPR